MAYYDIKHTCGHTVSHDIYGKHTDRDKKIEWLKQNPCTACRIQEAYKDANQILDGAGFCELFGTKKQRVWAQQIRAQKYKRFLECKEELLKIAPEEKLEVIKERLDEALNKLKSINVAADWIALRDSDLYGLAWMRDLFF